MDLERRAWLSGQAGVEQLFELFLPVSGGPPGGHMDARCTRSIVDEMRDLTVDDPRAQQRVALLQAADRSQHLTWLERTFDGDHAGHVDRCEASDRDEQVFARAKHLSVGGAYEGRERNAPARGSVG